MYIVESASGLGSIAKRLIEEARRKAAARVVAPAVPVRLPAAAAALLDRVAVRKPLPVLPSVMPVPRPAPTVIVRPAEVVLAPPVVKGAVVESEIVRAVRPVTLPHIERPATVRPFARPVATVRPVVRPATVAPVSSRPEPLTPPVSVRHGEPDVPAAAPASAAAAGDSRRFMPWLAAAVAIAAVLLMGRRS